jgi:hypothetical protein
VVAGSIPHPTFFVFGILFLSLSFSDPARQDLRVGLSRVREYSLASQYLQLGMLGHPIWWTAGLNLTRVSEDRNC